MYEVVTIIICATTVIVPAAAHLVELLRGSDMSLAVDPALSTTGGRVR